MAGTQKIKAGAAWVEVSADATKFEKEMRKAEAHVKQFGEKVQAVGMGFAKLGAAILGPLTLTIKAASNMEEVMNKFNVVFGESSAAVKEWSDVTADAMGRSKRQIAEFVAGTQDLFVPIGFAKEQALEMSKQITTLAVDVASFNNKVDSDVLRDFTAALTGGGETVKKYGVLINVATTKQKLLQQGIDPKKATEQEKVYARLAILLEGTTAAQGDAIRSADSAANQYKRLNGVLEDTSAEIGNALLPMTAELLSEFSEMAKAIGEWASENGDLIRTIAKIGAALLAVGAALVAFGIAIKGAAALIGLATIAGKAFLFVLTLIMAHPVIAAIAGIGAAIAGLIWLFSDANDEAEAHAKAMDAVNEQAKKHADLLERQAKMIREVVDAEKTLEEIGSRRAKNQLAIEEQLAALRKKQARESMTPEERKIQTVKDERGEEISLIRKRVEARKTELRELQKAERKAGFEKKEGSGINIYGSTAREIAANKEIMEKVEANRKIAAEKQKKLLEEIAKKRKELADAEKKSILEIENAKLKSAARIAQIQADAEAKKAKQDARPSAAAQEQRDTRRKEIAEQMRDLNQEIKRNEIALSNMTDKEKALALLRLEETQALNALADDRTVGADQLIGASELIRKKFAQQRALTEAAFARQNQTAVGLVATGGFSASLLARQVAGPESEQKKTNKFLDMIEKTQKQVLRAVQNGGGILLGS